ncbi:MAG: FIST N-terminal domain-containing protein [Chitinophagales bacterium]
MKVKTIHGYSIAEITNGLEKLLQSEFQPTLAFVFTSVAYNIEELSNVFTQKEIDIVGSTTSGEFIDDEVFEKSIVVMLMDINRDYYRIYFGEVGEYTKTYEVGNALANYSKEHFSNPAYISVFSTAINGELLVSGIDDVLQNDFRIFGGMAGDDAAMVATYAFTNHKSSDNALVALILDADKIAVNGLALSGWEPLGATNVITKSTGNIIYTINNKPALDIFKAFFGEYHSVNEEDGTVAIATAQYPIQVERNGGYALRAPLNANEEDGSLMMAGPVREGEKFRFSIAPGFEIIENTVDGFKDFRDEHQDADALILFSCLARHMSLGPLVEQEIEGISELWDAPLVGFFTYGEIGRNSNGASNFYNETCSLVTLKEI